MSSRTEKQKPLKLVVSRRFKASSETVFDAWLDPDSVCHWLFATPDGVMKRVEIDPRVGGRFRIDEQRGDEIAEHFGEYLVVDRPRRLVFSFATSREEKPTAVTVEIKPDGDGCVLTLSHDIAPEWADYEQRTREGWTLILAGLEAQLMQNAGESL